MAVLGGTPHSTRGDDEDFQSLCGRLPLEMVFRIVKMSYTPAISFNPVGAPDQKKNRESLALLARMCLVSKDFRRLAEPLLYEECVFEYDFRLDVQKDHATEAKRLESFVRTIMARPDLAAHIKRAYICMSAISQFLII